MMYRAGVVLGIVLVVLSAPTLGVSIVQGMQQGNADTHLPAPSICNRARPGIVYARAGTIERVQPNGGGRCILMMTLGGHMPVLSAGGHLLAFLAQPDGSPCTGCGRLVIARIGSHTRVLLATHATAPGTTGMPGWSPDGRYLAFLQDPDLRIWDARCRCSQVVIHGTKDRPITSFAWSPDSHRIAAAHIPRNGVPGLSLPITIATLPTRKQQSIGARLPSWVWRPRLGGSYPSSLIGWTAGNRLLIQSSGAGLGRELTGIWSARPQGGLAQKVLAPPRTGRLTPTSPLWSATAALLSPDHTRLVLQRAGTFWVGTAADVWARFVYPAHRSQCAVTQFVWSNRSRLTYVTVCNSGRPEKPVRLFTASISSGRSTLLDSIRSRQQDALSIAPPIQCVACGAG